MSISYNSSGTILRAPLLLRAKFYLRLFQSAVLLSLFLCQLGVGGSEEAWAEASKAYRLKAAFLFQFASFVSWPEEAFAAPNAEFRYCVYRSNPFGDIFDAYTERKMQGREVVVNVVKSPDDLAGCQILFIPASEQQALAQLSTKAQHSNILTVSEQGVLAMITFVQKSSKLKFRIDLKQVEQAKLRISSKLLKLAISID